MSAIIEYKICTKCKEAKPADLEFFYKNGGGLTCRCKICVAVQGAEYRQNNKEKIAVRNAKYQRNNKETCAARHAKYYQANRDSIARRKASHRKKNKEKINARIARVAHLRLKSDPDFRMVKNLRRRLRHALKGTSKSAPTLELLGCTIEELHEHLESQFTEGMTWENRGSRGWHIDHIRPCASFDLTDPAQQRECFHYTNLQPLWAEDNLKKGDSYSECPATSVTPGL